MPSARLGEWSNVLCKSRRPQFSAAGRRADVPLSFASRRRGPTYTPYSLPGPSLHVASSFHAAVIHTDSQSSLHLSLSEKLRYAPPADHSHGTCAGSYRGARLARFLLALHHTHRTDQRPITTNPISPVFVRLSHQIAHGTHAHTTERRPPALSALPHHTRTPLFPYALCKHRRHPKSNPKSPDTSIPFFQKLFSRPVFFVVFSCCLALWKSHTTSSSSSLAPVPLLLLSHHHLHQVGRGAS